MHYSAVRLSRRAEWARRSALQRRLSCQRGGHGAPYLLCQVLRSNGPAVGIEYRLIAYRNPLRRERAQGFDNKGHFVGEPVTPDLGEQRVGFPFALLHFCDVAVGDGFPEF